jgi:fatty acid desaturase
MSEPAERPTALRPATHLGDYLDPREIEALQRIQPGRLAARLGLEWLLILAALALWARVPEPAVWLLAFVVIGTRQHALVNLAHEGAHYNLSRNHRLNDWICDLLCAAPVLLETSSYRRGHLPHHVHLGDAELDSERRTWINVRGLAFLRVLLMHVSGFAMLRAAFRYAGGTGADAAPRRVRYVAAVALTNGALLGFCWALGAPFAYLHLWLYPLFALALLLVSLLAIAQHQPEAYAARGVEDPTADLRPTPIRDAIGSPLERFLFATVGAAYHHEHHLLPGVPHTRLPRLHALLRERGFYREREHELRRSYAGTLHDLIRGPRRPASTHPAR